MVRVASQAASEDTPHMTEPSLPAYSVTDTVLCLSLATVVLVLSPLTMLCSPRSEILRSVLSRLELGLWPDTRLLS